MPLPLAAALASNPSGSARPGRRAATRQGTAPRAPGSESEPNTTPSRIQCGLSTSQLKYNRRFRCAAASASPSTSGIVDEDQDTSSGAQSSRTSRADPVPSIYDIVDDDYTTNAASIRLRSISEDSPSQGAVPSAGSQSPQTAGGRDNGLASYHAPIREENREDQSISRLSQP
jgi:hypothetical protein